MNIDEIPQYLRYEYVKECNCCGYEEKILTQSHDSPEYETEIYVQCQCGEYIKFELPVN